MGVVYKARQISLNRIVALKMILVGAYAGAGHVARFRTEARAVARLKHPHIVQIYEIGEQDGLPYLALEFVQGGRLDQKIAGTPLAAEKAARMAEILARAVHHAHQRGIIHRDLKPENVLLEADGTPKITDFGLAKRMDAETGPTQSGVILGTPSYMAPEQAGGKRGEIGPATDVYSLGAILYEMLAGHPPFHSGTHMDILLQVVSAQPAAPSQYYHGLSPALEAICLKCLHKDASERYASAQALADDLRAFLTGQSVSALPKSSAKLKQPNPTTVRPEGKAKPVAVRPQGSSKPVAVPKKSGTNSHKAYRRGESVASPGRRSPAKKKLSVGILIAAGVLGGLILLAGVAGAIWWFTLHEGRSTQVRAPATLPKGSAEPGPGASTDETQTGGKGPKPDLDKQHEPPPGKVYTPDEVYQHLLKSTVWVLNTEQIRGGNQVGAVIGSGSGVLVHREQRLVLTNFHVVDDIADAIVIFPVYKNKQAILTPKYYGENAATLGIKVTVVARDPGHDLALLQLDAVPASARPLRLAPKSPKSGENVHSIGGSGVNLATGEGTLWRYTPGKVRSVYQKQWNYQGGQHVDSYIVETDSPTNPGDSGGPVVNNRGEMVALVSGGDRSKQLVSMNIDVREIRGLLEQYFEKQVGKKWEEEPATAPAEQIVDVPTQIKKLSDADSRERLKAILALGDLGADGQAAVSSLIPLLKDKDPAIRRAASSALDQIGPPPKADFGVILKALQSDDPEARLYAAHTVASSGIGDLPVPEAIPVLAAALKDNDPAVRKDVVIALGNLGPQARGAAPDLLAKLKDSDADVRKNAVQAVSKVGVEGKGSVPILIELLKDSRVETRRAGAALLAKLGPDGKEAAPALAAALRDPDRQIRRSVLDALGQLGADAKPAVPALRDVLRDQDKTLQQSAIDVLAQLGPAAKEAVPDLIDLLEAPLLREAAVTALGKIGKPAVAALKNALGSSSVGIRVGACMALGEIGPDAKEALLVLSGLQRDSEPTVRDAAATAMRKVQRKK
jgi:serine/threonine protein kinase/HEAT repeat protein